MHDTATTVIYTLSYTTLFRSPVIGRWDWRPGIRYHSQLDEATTSPGTSTSAITPRGTPNHVDNRHYNDADRKSTRLNSSHVEISYAVFCLKKKKQIKKTSLST